MKLRAFDALGTALTEARSTDPDDPYAQLNAMALAYLGFAGTYPGQYALMFHTSPTGSCWPVRSDSGNPGFQVSLDHG